MKILIAGRPGTGKSTISKALKDLGYAAYDADHVEGLAQWQERATGKTVERNYNPTKDWFKKHAWNWSAEKLKELLDSANMVFIAGSSSNQEEFYDWFDKILLIQISDKELHHRLSTRRTNDFGKHPNEIADILSWSDWFNDHLMKRGAIAVDGTLPIKKVIDKILTEVDET